MSLDDAIKIIETYARDDDGEKSEVIVNKTIDLWQKYCMKKWVKHINIHGLIKLINFIYNCYLFYVVLYKVSCCIFGVWFNVTRN